MSHISDRSWWNVTRVYERRVSPDHRYCGAQRALATRYWRNQDQMESSEDGTQSQGVSDGMQYIAVCMTWSEDGEIVPLIAKLLLWFNPDCDVSRIVPRWCEMRQVNNQGMEVFVKVISIRWSRDLIMLKRWIQRMLIQSYVTGIITHWQKKFNEAENL